MIYSLGDILLRPPDPRDTERLYEQKNDPVVASMLGGFTTGYSRKGIEAWIERHRHRSDEALWVIARLEDDRCLGHVGLYQIDHRVRSAEFAIMIGDRSAWGSGIGARCTKFVLGYGFRELNLNRISLQVLAVHDRAIRLYRAAGFREEGILRQAMFKSGSYLDVLVMSMLRMEYSDDAER